MLDGRFLLMELELIEPNLFLSLAGAVDAFADRVMRHVPALIPASP